MGKINLPKFMLKAYVWIKKGRRSPLVAKFYRKWLIIDYLVRRRAFAGSSLAEWGKITEQLGSLNEKNSLEPMRAMSVSSLRAIKARLLAEQEICERIVQNIEQVEALIIKNIRKKGFRGIGVSEAEYCRLMSRKPHFKEEIAKLMQAQKQAEMIIKYKNQLRA
ncbi:MAG: hypothetical protein PHD95_05805 [Candidatus ainarchaeum sp.]|nr:hypothetical protein [Candidatus ainarchaeum sp.]